MYCFSPSATDEERNGVQVQPPPATAKPATNTIRAADKAKVARATCFRHLPPRPLHQHAPPNTLGTARSSSAVGHVPCASRTTCGLACTIRISGEWRVARPGKYVGTCFRMHLDIRSQFPRMPLNRFATTCRSSPKSHNAECKNGRGFTRERKIPSNTFMVGFAPALSLESLSRRASPRSRPSPREHAHANEQPKLAPVNQANRDHHQRRTPVTLDDKPPGPPGLARSSSRSSVR